MDLLARQDAVEVCQLTNFAANQDFYGFGIRLGVYLQWLSSWISNTLDPEDASENHEENSIFVLAIAVAIVLAYETDDLRVSEFYIMMLIMNGYFAIVLSTWGVRLHLLRPGQVHVSPLFWHGSKVDTQVPRTRAAKWPGGQVLNAMANHYLAERTMPLSQGGSVKPTGLSWAGAVWRSLIALFVIALNLYLWFTYDPDTEDNPDCRPTIYFFGSRPITHQLRAFFIAVLLIVGTVVFQLLIQMLSVFYLLIVRCLLGPLFDLLRLGWVKDSLLGLIHRRLKLANHSGIVPTEEITLLHIRSALFELCAQKPPPGAPSHVHPQHHHEKGFKLSLVLVICWHVFLLAMMSLFIAFIEMTIQINNMQGAFVIKSTSQLIPFIIGLISMLNTCRQLMLEWYAEDHPNEDNTHFVLTGSLGKMSLLGMGIGFGMRVMAFFTGGRKEQTDSENQMHEVPPVERPGTEDSLPQSEEAVQIQAEMPESGSKHG